MHRNTGMCSELGQGQNVVKFRSHVQEITQMPASVDLQCSKIPGFFRTTAQCDLTRKLAGLFSKGIWTLISGVKMTLGPNPHRTRDATRAQIGTFFL